MSGTTGNLASRMNTVSDVDDMGMFHAMRATGRRNAMADLGEQLAQGRTSTLSFSSSPIFIFSECRHYCCRNGEYDPSFSNDVNQTVMIQS